DLNKNLMTDTIGYLKLYVAINKKDIETVRNLTLLSPEDKRLHLGIATPTNIYPIDIAIMDDDPKLLADLIDIIIKQQPQKQKQKKKKSENEDNLLLFGEEQSSKDDDNKNNITTFTLAEILGKYNYLKYCVEKSAVDCLKYFLTLNEKFHQQQFFSKSGLVE